MHANERMGSVCGEWGARVGRVCSAPGARSLEVTITNPTSIERVKAVPASHCRVEFWWCTRRWRCEEQRRRSGQK
jgi:hypothetical protein